MPISSRKGSRESTGLFEMPFAVRDGDGGCGHRHLSGQSLSQWSTRCASGCTHILGSVYYRLTRRVAIGLLFVLTAIHPLVHQFEGGVMDALLGMLLVRAASDE